MNRFPLFLIGLLLSTGLMAQNKIRIIPQPLEVKEKLGHLQLSGDLSLQSDEISLYQLLDYTVDLAQDEWGTNVEVNQETKTGSVLQLHIDEDIKNSTRGAYELKVNSQGINITSASEQGLFYGVQTLRQLVSSDGHIPYLEIKDAPRFGWRAFMLDEGRYFKGKEQVFKMLDEMARLKMNIFHWHLVDDQGWRIEIKKYPLLTEVGSKRPSTQVGPLRWDSPIQSGEPHEGFYTQEDIKEVVDYAAQLHITIVPEIEMPGHSSAAIAAYPWLGSSGKTIEVPIWFGVSRDIYNVADPKVYDFLTDVLDEVITLFPSKVIHIGGDEAKYDHWENSAGIKKYMKDNNLKTFADLQVFFTNRISQYLESKGRRMMGWNEILGQRVHEYQTEKEIQDVEEELSKNSVVHFWKGDIALMQSAAESGYDIVNSIQTDTYLDYSYETTPLKKAYDFEPVPLGLKAKYHNKIKGLGCQMWGEWIPKSGYMDFMIFPRIAAYAEVGWTPKGNKDYEAFKGALSNLFKVWQEKGIYHAPMEFAEPGSGKWVRPR